MTESEIKACTEEIPGDQALRTQSKFRLFDRVRITEIDKAGIVGAMMLDREGIQYRVMYWWDGSRKFAWCCDFEIMLCSDPKRQIGFYPEETSST